MLAVTKFRIIITKGLAIDLLKAGRSGHAACTEGEMLAVTKLRIKGLAIDLLKAGRSGHAACTEGEMLAVTKFRIRFEWPGRYDGGRALVCL